VTVAAALVAADLALRQAVGEWQGRGALPAAVIQPALQEQLLERRLAHDARLRRNVLAQLPQRLRRDVADDVQASLDITAIARIAHLPPRPLSAFRVTEASPPLRLKAYYLEAQRRSRVAWQVLAAINYVESDFGRLDTRAGGGQGPMQFIPSTWARYGRGDRHDPHQAILAAGRLLAAAGARRDLRAALRHYNPYPTYTDAIVRLSGRIRRDPAVFLQLYARRLFVRTKHGFRRLNSHL
jgi:membrane-bound lytic murein transglycosylase B